MILATLVEHFELADTMDNISMAKFSASDEEINTKKIKKRTKKTKEREDNGNKHHENSSLYCSLHGEKNIHTSRYFKVLKERASDKDKSKYDNRDYNNKFKELNLLQEEAAHQKSKYEKLNKAYTKRKTSK